MVSSVVHSFKPPPSAFLYRRLEGRVVDQFRRESNGGHVGSRRFSLARQGARTNIVGTLDNIVRELSNNPRPRYDLVSRGKQLFRLVVIF